LKVVVGHVAVQVTSIARHRHWTRVIQRRTVVALSLAAWPVEWTSVASSLATWPFRSHLLSRRWTRVIQLDSCCELSLAAWPAKWQQLP